MDHALRQVGRPVLFQKSKISFRLADEARFHRIRALTRQVPQRAPVGKRQAIATAQRKISSCQMHMCQPFADRFAMLHRRAAHPHAFKESDDCSRPSGKLANCRAITANHRLRAFQPTASQMLHQAEKERQIFAIGALFVKRQDK